MATINGLDTGETHNGNPNESDTIFGNGGDDIIAMGESTPAFFDFANGGAGDDEVTVTGSGTVVGGEGDDRIIGISSGDIDNGDFVVASYRESIAGITANLTGTAQGGLAAGSNGTGFQVADGVGGTDTISGVHTIADTAFGDTFFVDSTYQNSFGNWMEIQLSGGDDTVIFDGVTIGSVNYSSAGGAVLLDLEAGTATDRFGGDAIGNDTISGGNRARGTSFDDELRGSNGNDQLRGRQGNDVLIGGGGDDVLFGEERVATPSGGNDTLIGGAGADQLVGGLGYDFADYSTSAAAVTVNLMTGATSGGDAAGDTFETIEGVRGSALADTLTAGATGGDSHMLEGNGGDDLLTIIGLGGMLGGEGDDRIVGVSSGDTENGDFVAALYYSSPAGIVANLTGEFNGGLGAGNNEAGFQVADGLGGVDLLSGVHTIGDTGGNDQFFVDSSYQTSFGNWMEIQLTSGDDTVSFDGVTVGSVNYSGAGGAVLLDLAAGTATDRFGGDFIGSDTITGANRARGTAFDDELRGSDGNDQLRGRGGNDVLIGGGGDDVLFGEERVATSSGGNDTLIGGAGADQLVGGAGNDTADYSTSAAAVTVNLLTGVATGGDAEGDTFASIEEVRGSAQGDTLTAGATVNNWQMLHGGDGDDLLTIVGLGGIVGGNGDDRIVGVSSGDIDNGDFVNALYFTSPAAIVANLTGATQGGLAGGNNEAGFAVADGLGGVDLISGVHTIGDTSGDDQFFVDSSYQTSFGNWMEIQLTSGDDTVNFDGVTVGSVNYSGAGGAVLLDLAAGTATDRAEGSFIGSDTFAGANRARGTSFDDELRGSAGNDQLRGRQGDDLISGGDGDDLLYGDERAAQPWGGNDILAGGQGSDTLVGGLGADIAEFEGASTDYTFKVGGAGLQVTEKSAGANGLIDTDSLASIETLRFSDGDFAASSFVTTDIPSEGDDTIQLDDEGGSVDGGEGNDFITGGAGDDSLSGGAGVDTLVGGAGNETLDGGEGADIMLGGEGDDTYLVNDTFDLVDEGYVFPDAGFGGNDTIESVAEWFWDVYGIGETVEIAEGATGSGPGEPGTTIVAGVFDNTIIGNSGTNILFGRGGSDTYMAKDGIDFISLSLLGVPEDLYEGVDGPNTIVVEARESGPVSYDIVFEFESGKDRFDVSDYGFATQAEAFARGVDDGAGNSYFVLGDGFDYLYVVGLELSELTAADFIV